MCGIVGIYLKNEDLNPELGKLLAAMLIQMSDRGPDSAGIALYRDPVDDSSCKLTLHAAVAYDWDSLQTAMAAHLQADVKLDVSALEELGLMMLAARDADGELTSGSSSIGGLNPGDALVLYGRDSGHEALEDISRLGEAGKQEAASSKQ